ncbi:hypothetical protein EOD00_22295 [Mesorhizobium sp. M7A.T.Ca.TU.009.01.3.1]|nr:hypothetical protein EOD00_22295 [Mesorhizobium sp. M7A.T.Ca.TU.009.01.3.1]
MSAELPISPLEGEMSGRTEGGVVERRPQEAVAAKLALNAARTHHPPCAIHSARSASGGCS